MQDFVYPIGNIDTFTFLWHKPQNLFMDNSYCQLLYGQQSTSATLNGNIFFDQKYTANYNISVSSLYYSIANNLNHITENNYNLVGSQSNPGIWKSPSLTSTDSQVANRVQQFKISRYYYQDEIANGSFRFYYLPSISTNYPSITGLQTQNVLRFININEDYFGPTFAITGNQVSNNFSGCASAITVDVIWRPIPQQNSGYIWHRDTTDGSNVLKTYSDTSSGSVSSYPFYSNEPSNGMGVYFNHLSPVYDVDQPKPYFDFYVYGQLNGATGHYLSLSSGLINQQTSSRFYLEQSTLNTLFDGNFHSLRFVWDINLPKNSSNKIFLDGILLNGYSNGTGRTQPVNFTLNNIASFSSLTSTPFYFFSKSNNVNLNNQTSSLFSAYGETKHIFVFDKGFSSNFIDASLTSNSQINSSLGSTTSNLCAWFSFNNSLSGLQSVDIAKNYTNHVTTSVTGTISNDTSNNIIEGSIDRIFGLLHDRVGNFLNSTYDGLQDGPQRIVGKIYSNEYGVSSSGYIGAIFYDKGNIVILNDHYNTDVNQSTQLFVSSTGSFGIYNSNSVWKSQYLSFLGTKYVERNTISVTGFAEHFAKSTNQSSYFEGSDGNAYTKNNAKAITGIVWFGKNGRPIATTKFSNVIYKPENNDVVFNINIDI